MGPFDSCRVYIDVMFVRVGTLGWVLVWLRTYICIYIKSPYQSPFISDSIDNIVLEEKIDKCHNIIWVEAW